MYILPSKSKISATSPFYLKDSLWAFETGELFDAIINMPFSQCAHVYAQLEERGISLSDAGYMVVLVCTNQAFSYSNVENMKLVQMVYEQLSNITCSHLFSSKGRIYALLDFPNANNGDFDRESAINSVGTAMNRVLHGLEESEHRVGIIVSSLHYGREMIAECAFEVENRSDFHDFLEFPPPLKVFFEEYSILGNFGQTMEFYRQLSNRIVVLLKSDVFSAPLASQELIDGLITACERNIVPVYTHMHMLSLLLTETIIESGVGESEFTRQLLQRKNMLTSTSEKDVKRLYKEYLTELRQHYLEMTQNHVAEKMHHVREYVEKNITSYDLSVTGIADVFQINRSLLTSQFKRYYGVNLSSFIQNCRVKVAKALMAEKPSWSTEQVAKASGYSSLSTMYRAFKKLDGVAPGSYKS